MEYKSLNNFTKQQQLVNYFTKLIAEGRYAPGDVLPPEVTIAKEFGVNRSTVGKALASLASAGVLVRKQGSGTYVAECELSRHHQEVDANESQPKKESKLLLVISSLFTNSPNYLFTPHSEIISGIEAGNALSQEKNRVSLFNTYPEKRITDSMLKQIEKSGAFGVIYVVGDLDFSDAINDIANLKKMGIPLVVAAISKDYPDVDQTCISQEDFGYLGARHLLGCGHKELLYVIPEMNPEWLTRRLNGFRRALDEAGVAFREEMIFRYGHELGCMPDMGKREGAAAAKIILEKELPCTAILAVNDAYAAGMQEYFREKGVNLPERFSLVGADDHYFFRHCNLTTVKQPCYESGMAAYEMIAGQMAGEKKNYYEHRDLKPYLLERSSCSIR